MPNYTESETVRKSQAADAAREEAGHRRHEAVETQIQATTAETLARADQIAATETSNPGDKSPR